MRMSLVAVVSGAVGRRTGRSCHRRRRVAVTWIRRMTCRPHHNGVTLTGELMAEVNAAARLSAVSVATMVAGHGVGRRGLGIGSVPRTSAASRAGGAQTTATAPGPAAGGGIRLRDCGCLRTCA
jgi:hypothetical protein